MKEISVGMLLLTVCYCSGVCAQCRDDTRILQIDELEQYGIDIQLKETGKGGMYQTDLRIQPEICIKTGERHCSLAKYNVAGLTLQVKDSLQEIKLMRPNVYEYTASVELLRGQLNSASLVIRYEGTPCDDQHLQRQKFIVSLKGLPTD